MIHPTVAGRCFNECAVDFGEILVRHHRLTKRIVHYHASLRPAMTLSTAMTL